MHSDAPGLRPPIFVGGTGRSGTTVFSRLLGSHPGIFSLRWETQFIVAKHGLIDLVGNDFGDVELAKFLELMRGRWFRRTLNKGRPNEYSAGLCDDVSESQLEGAIEDLDRRIAGGGRSEPVSMAGEFVSALFDSPARSAGANRWCEKTPRNSLYMEKLAEMFPGAKFINVLRDGRDVACSMVERSFWPIGATHDFPTTNRFRGDVTFEKAIEYWVEMVQLARTVSERIPEGSYYEVRLEDLVFDQERTVRGVLGFLDEPFDSSPAEFAMRPDSIGRWKRDLDSGEVDVAERVAGDLLRAERFPA